MSTNAFGKKSKTDLMKHIHSMIDKLLCARGLKEGCERSKYLKRDELRYGESFKGGLREDGRLNESHKITLSTMKGYLTKARKAVAETGLKHHLFDSEMNSIIKTYPLHKDDLEAFFDMTFPDAIEYRKTLLKSFSERLNGDISKADKTKLTRLIARVKKIEIVPVIIQGLALSEDDKSQLVNTATTVRKMKKSSRIKIDTKVVHSMIIDLLTHENTYANALGISLATGRRLIETVIQGDFEIVSKYEFRFSGQAKNRGRTKPYVIPTLAPTDLILKAFHKLRSSSQVQSLMDVMNRGDERYSPYELFNNSSRAFTLFAKAYLTEYFGDKKYETWMFKDSRAIYARLTYSNYENECVTNKKDPMDEGDFFTKVLGHTDELSKENYKMYYSTDVFDYVCENSIQERKEMITDNENKNASTRLKKLKSLLKNVDEKRVIKQLTKLIPFIEDHPLAVIDSKFLRETIKGKTVNHKPLLELLESKGINKI